MASVPRYIWLCTITDSVVYIKYCCFWKVVFFMRFHSVTLDADKCKGCINCIKRCPTQAIRVRAGKAVILSELCVDCGECIRVCPHHAKKAVFDSLDLMSGFKYNIAMPAPTIYGQIANMDDIDYVLTAFKHMGFDDVFEVARAAELVSESTRLLMMKEKIKYPIISSACPAVERLIKIRFPELCENVLPLLSPMEIGAKVARREAAEKTGIVPKDIGVFFISPCPAKVTDIKRPIGCEESAVSGALSIADIYPKLIGRMNKIKSPEPLSKTGLIGVSWAGSGGESAALLDNSYLAADGIENVIKVLEEVEDEKLNDVHFIELNACPGGCVGGVLTVENPYVAKTRIQLLRKYLPISKNHLSDGVVPDEMNWSKPISPSRALKLSDSISESMRMRSEIDDTCARLPGLDCGSCGAPTCRALAEDVVKGFACENDCVFTLRERVKELAKSVTGFGRY